MAFEAICDKDGGPLAGEVRPALAVWSDADRALGEFVRVVVAEEEIPEWRKGAKRLSKSGKLIKNTKYVAPPVEDEDPPKDNDKPKKPAKPKKVK
jgi:hypothetical protein